MTVRSSERTKQGGFLKQVRRLLAFMPVTTSRERGDPDGLALERRFLAERRATVEREIERRADDLAYRFPQLIDTIESFAHRPLPARLPDGDPAAGVQFALRPLRRELDVLDALGGVIEQRPLVEVLDMGLTRVEREIAEALRAARPAGMYGDDYWSDELLEGILSHLLHLWALWLQQEAGGEQHREGNPG